MSVQRIDNTRLDALIADMRRQVERMDQSRAQARREAWETAKAERFNSPLVTLGSFRPPRPLRGLSAPKIR